MSKILVIDDEEMIRDLLAEILGLDGHEILKAEDGEEGVRICGEAEPDVVISDLTMPKMGGLEVLKRIKENALANGQSGPGVILLTGQGDSATIVEALRLGAFDFASKPVDFDKLWVSIRRILELQTAERERERLKGQLYHSAKQASVGTLAAGIAHELNNPLAVVVAYVEQFLAALKEPLSGPRDNGKSATMAPDKLEEIEGYLSMIAKSTTRMNLIVNNLLAYAHQSESTVWREVDVNEVIRSSLLFLKGSFEKNHIASPFVLGSDLPPVWGDTGQLESVFTNLMANSRDAFETVKDDREKQVTLSSARSAKGDVLIVYEDNAGGMTAETLQRVFDPFFTTKEVGKGTGLGMSVTFGVVENHKGTISVESEFGKGTKFTLTFPACQAKN
ncbi:response regulator [Bdellovibrionota bacterium FG-2]